MNPTVSTINNESPYFASGRTLSYTEAMAAIRNERHQMLKVRVVNGPAPTWIQGICYQRPSRIFEERMAQLGITVLFVECDRAIVPACGEMPEIKTSYKGYAYMVLNHRGEQ